MSVSSKAEGEASRKGLAGAAKRQYVGGAINRAKHEKAEAATPAARQRKQQHSYQRAAPTTRPLQKLKSAKSDTINDAAFADAVQRAVDKRENGSGFATFPDVREELRRETGLSNAAINNRLRKLRDEGDAGRAPITLHFEPDEDRMHIARRGQLTWRGHDFDVISVLPSVQEQKRRDTESMQRVRQEEAEIFRAHGMTPPVRDQATGKVLKPARPLRKSKQQAHSYQREAVADARAQIRYHEAQIAGLREGVKLRRELAGPKRAATPKTPAPKRPRTIDEQIAAAGGYVPKTPADKLRKTPVRELTDAQLLRDWENHPPERRRGVLEREMARRQAKAAKAQQPAPRRVQAGARPGGKRAKVGRSDGILSPREAAEIRLTPRPGVEDVDFDPSAPLNPYQLHELYGDAQMRPALSRYTAPRLREAVRAVQARNPGTRPAGADRGAMIHYIEQHVSGAAKPAAPAPRRAQAGAKPGGKRAKKPATTPPRAAPITRPLPKEATIDSVFTNMPNGRSAVEMERAVRARTQHLSDAQYETLHQQVFDEFDRAKRRQNKLGAEYNAMVRTARQEGRTPGRTPAENAKWQELQEASKRVAYLGAIRDQISH